VSVKLENTTPILENMSEDYFLYSPIEGKAKLDLEGKEYIFVLEQKNRNEKNYEGGDLFHTLKTKRWFGMEKMIIKENTNYILVKGKSKKRVFIFTIKEDTENKYDLNGGNYYSQDFDISFYDGDELGGEGFSFFNDKTLPYIIQTTDGGRKLQTISLPKGFKVDNTKEEIEVTAEEKTIDIYRGNPTIREISLKVRGTLK